MTTALLLAACGGDPVADAPDGTATPQTTETASEATPTETTTSEPETSEPETSEPETSEPETDGDSATDTTGSAGEVTIVDFAFDPATVEVAAGTEITWTNQDVAAHTVTADDGEAFGSEVAADGGTFSATLDEPGTYGYHCEFHPYMEATVEVTG